MFPPPGPVTTQRTIPSYLYVEYQGSDSMQAFIDAYNALAQEYVDTFNGLNLPIYTGLSAPLLDWVALGLYGMRRPALASGSGPDLGPFNTLELNTEPFNFFLPYPDTPAPDTSDDTFKRILTWAFFKGDGRQFDIRWLKRRIMRFLVGENGENVDTAATYDISIEVVGSSVTITITGDTATSPAAVIFADAVTSGALELPFQYSFAVVI